MSDGLKLSLAINSLYSSDENHAPLLSKFDPRYKVQPLLLSILYFVLLLANFVYELLIPIKHNSIKIKLINLFS